MTNGTYTHKIEMKRYAMYKLTVVVLVVMLLTITYAVTFCTPKDEYYLMTATAYCPCKICCGTWSDGFTYTKDIAKKGCIAIDPTNGPLKFGQKVYVEGYGYGVCNDIGESITNWKIDLCFNIHQEALEYGVKLVRVYIIKGGK